jgi:hypothetical protein
MRRVAHATALAVGLSACTLLTKLDGLSGGPLDDGGAPGSDATTGGDGSLADASNDGRDIADGGTDGEGGPSCGSPGPTSGLLAYYPFDEGMGNAVHDCSNNHFDGAFIRQADGGSWTPGKKGGAIRVDAPNGCVDLGVQAQLQPQSMTVTAWINIASLPPMGASGYVIGQAANADVAGWRIGARYTNAVGFELTTAGMSYLVDTPAPAPGTWHHVAMAFKPNDKLEIFVDGTSTKVQNALPPITFVAVSIRIGCRSDDANYFSGMIDELRIYDRVLTQAEITALAAP